MKESKAIDFLYGDFVVDVHVHQAYGNKIMNHIALHVHNNAQKMKFSIKHCFSKCDQIRGVQQDNLLCIATVKY